jgi:hypothetical protein
VSQSQLAEGYERIRAQRRCDRGWGAELLRRQGLAAWVEVALEHGSPRGARRSGDEAPPAASAGGGVTTVGWNASMVRLLADVALARIEEELS